MATVGERMQCIRTKRGVLIADLEKASGISRDAIICYESGQTEPTPEKLLTIAEALDVKPNKLCDPYFLFLIYPYRLKLKEWRKALHMTQREFAEYCGYPLETIKRWEQGVHRVTRAQWERLSALMELENKLQRW